MPIIEELILSGSEKENIIIIGRYEFLFRLRLGSITLSVVFSLEAIFFVNVEIGCGA